MTEPGTIPEESPDLNKLDRLIDIYFDVLVKVDPDKVKLGDLLKMMELKRKLAPSDDARRLFWQMLDKLRKETLEPKSAPTEDKSTAGDSRHAA